MRPDPVAGTDAHALGAEVGGLGQHLGGEDAVPDDLLRVIEIVDKQIERLHPLFQAGIGAVPLLFGNDARHDVERPGPVDVAASGVDGEGNAHDQDGEFGGGLALAQVLVAQRGQVFAQGAGGRTGSRTVTDEFVVTAGSSVLLPVDGHSIISTRALGC